MFYDFSTSDITVKIQDELNALLSVSAEQDAVFVCDLVENYLLDKIKDAFFNELKIIAEEKKVKFSSSSHKRFFFNESLYEFKEVEYSNSSTIIHISIKAVHPVKSTFSQKPYRIKFDSAGRYNEIQISSDIEFIDYQNRLAELAKIILESGYRWLLEFVRESIDRIQDETATFCYSLIRRLFNEKIAEKIFLWKVSDNKGIYLIDHLTLRYSLAQAKKRNVIENISPIEIISDFTSKVTAFEKVKARIAIEEDKIIQDDFSVSEYAETGHHLTEMIIYQNKQFVAQPLVREGKILLIAGYPAELHQLVESTLYKERDKFKEIINKSVTKFKNSDLALRNQGILTKKSLDEIPDTYLARIIRSVELKPNFAGMGINLNNILEIYLKWHYRDYKKSNSEDSK